MKKSILQNKWFLFGAVVLGTVVVLAVAYQLAAKALIGRIEDALGPDSSAGSIHITFSGVQIDDLLIRGPSGWPSPQVLKAHRVNIEPDLRNLWSDHVLRIRHVRISDATITCLRTREGRLRVLPDETITSQPLAGATPPKPLSIAINEVELQATRLEIYDATVRTVPYKLVIEPVLGHFDNLALPLAEERIGLELEGSLVSSSPRVANGTIKVSGWVNPTSRDSNLTTRVRGADLIVLQPYLLRAAETGVRRGTLDLDMQASVTKGHLDAPGTVVLNQLELAPSGSGIATFMGVSREVVLDGMKNKKGQIEVHFTLEGNLNDPKFSLNEGLALRAGAGLASALGVSVETIVKTVGSAGEFGVDAAGKVVEGAGSVVKKLIGK